LTTSIWRLVHTLTTPQLVSIIVNISVLSLYLVQAMLETKQTLNIIERGFSQLESHPVLLQSWRQWRWNGYSAKLFAFSNNFGVVYFFHHFKYYSFLSGISNESKLWEVLLVYLNSTFSASKYGIFSNTILIILTCVKCVPKFPINL